MNIYKEEEVDEEKNFNVTDLPPQQYNIIEKLIISANKEIWKIQILVNYLFKEKIKFLPYTTELEQLIYSMMKLLPDNFDNVDFPDYFTFITSLVYKHSDFQRIFIDNIEKIIDFMNIIIDSSPKAYRELFLSIKNISIPIDTQKIITSLNFEKVLFQISHYPHFFETTDLFCVVKYAVQISINDTVFLEKIIHLFIHEFYQCTQFPKQSANVNKVLLYILHHKDVPIELLMEFFDKYRKEKYDYDRKLNCVIFQQIYVEPKYTPLILKEILLKDRSLVEMYPIDFFLEILFKLIQRNSDKGCYSENIGAMVDLLLEIENTSSFYNKEFVEQLLGYVFNFINEGKFSLAIHQLSPMVLHALEVMLSTEPELIDIQSFLDYFEYSLGDVVDTGFLAPYLDQLLKFQDYAVNNGFAAQIEILQNHDFNQIVQNVDIETGSEEDNETLERYKNVILDFAEL